MDLNKKAIENIGMFMMKDGNKKTVTPEELSSVVSFLEFIILPKNLTEDEQDYTLDNITNWISRFFEKSLKRDTK